MKRGFTLVELSIVLVIVGLLIGGILAARSMISTTRVQATIKQIQQADAAVMNFKTKYNGLPGDSSRFGCGTTYVISGPGHEVCDNGFIESSDTTYDDGYYEQEIAAFWVHLTQSGFSSPGFNPQYTPNSGNDKAEKNTPPSPLGKNCTILPFGVNNTIVGAPDAGYNYYEIGDYTGITDDGFVTRFTDLNLPNFCAVSQDALALDNKIDDGVQNTGIVRGMNTGNIDNPMVPAKYAASSSSANINVKIQMFYNSGGTP